MNLVERAKKIVLQPKQEWAAIAEEEHTVQGLYTQYVMILAAIPAVAAFIGFSIVGVSGFGFGSTYRVPIGAGVANLVLTYLLALASVYVLAHIIDALAPHFGSQKDFLDSLKIAAFAPTAAWVAGIFYLIPMLGILALVGAVYSLYVLYLGIEALKEPSEDKTAAYTVVVIVAAIVVWVIAGAIAALVIPSPVRGF